GASSPRSWQRARLRLLELDDGPVQRPRRAPLQLRDSLLELCHPLLERVDHPVVHPGEVLPVKGPCTGARVSARAGYPDLPRLVRPLAGQLAGHGGMAMVHHVALLSDGIDGSTEGVHVEGDRVDLPPGRPFFVADDAAGGEAEVISQGGAQL